MRILVSNHLTGEATYHFFDTPEFIGHGLEMVENLCDIHASSNKKYMSIDVTSLADMTQLSGENLSTFSGRLQSTVQKIPL